MDINWFIRWIPWGDVKYTENLYRLGFDAAKENERHIDRVLNDFFA